MWQRGEGSLWLTATEELNPAKNHVRELGSGSFPSQAFR